MDASFCVNNTYSAKDGLAQMRFVCSVKDFGSGRRMECQSNQPGVQFYPGNFFATDQSLVGKENVRYGKGGGFVLLTRIYPDSINQESFPDDFILRPGNIYKQKVYYLFYNGSEKGQNSNMSVTV